MEPGPVACGPAGVGRTNDPAELSCDVTALGSVYLGGLTWAQLARSLRVAELRPGAFKRADALFRARLRALVP